MENQMPEEPTQATEQGFEIPVPTRERVLGDLAKVAKARPTKPSRRRRSGPQEQQ